METGTVSLKSWYRVQVEQRRILDKYVVQVLLFQPGDTGDSLRVCKVNTQPQLITDVKVNVNNRV